MRVLVAEDEPNIRALVVDTLKRGGFDVVEAGSGDEALQLLAFPDSVDILVTDINMPGADGIAVARSARAGNPGLPVLFVSGRPDMLAGSDAAPLPHRFLGKPFTLTRLAGLVGEMAREVGDGVAETS